MPDVTSLLIAPDLPRTDPQSLLPVPGPPEHRQALREILPKVALAPVGDPWMEWKLLWVLFWLCLYGPILVLFGLAIQNLSSWSVVAAVVTQLVGAAITFAWLFNVTPRSYSTLDIAKNMRRSFQNQFQADPKVEDLGEIIKEFDKPAITTGQHLLDFLISKSPVKWSVLLIVAALGANFVPLIDTSLKAEDVNNLRLPAAALGLFFGFFEFMRVTDRLFHDRRLAAAREWLRQIQEGVFPLSE